MSLLVRALRSASKLTTNQLEKSQLQRAYVFARSYSSDVTTPPAGRERTFQYDEELPPLPVPALQQTLNKYIDSVKPFLSDEELRVTEGIVKDFENGVGQTLQDKLIERSQTRKNWLEQWWEDKAYLETRLPLGVLQNPAGPVPTQKSVWPPKEGTQLERAAIFLWHTLVFYQILRKELLPVDKNRAGTRTFSMDQSRGLFHTCREPGVEKDIICRYFKTELEGPCPNHIHVICNGHIFKMVPFDQEGELLTAPELFRQLTLIKELSRERGQCIATLTSQERTRWAKVFNHLVSLDPINHSNLEAIKSSICSLVLDEGHPQNLAQTMEQGVAGPAYNRWYDKSFNCIVAENGVIMSNIEHGPFDGMAKANLSVYVYEQILKNGGDWPGETTSRSDLPLPAELIFTVDQLVEDEIRQAAENYDKMATTYDVIYSSFCQYGHSFLKNYNMHPDATIQLALQLAYYTNHNSPGSAYETATTRQFYHGRTETMRSCTMEAIDWCQAMQDPKADSSDKLELLRKAHDRHNSLMGEAASGQGVDRHLLGLYILSGEMGLPTPHIFTDKAYSLSGGGGNFLLSTSTLGYTSKLGVGGLLPMRHDGYMVCYRIGKEEFEFHVSSYKNCADTDAYRFFQQITRSLNRIGDLLSSEA